MLLDADGHIKITDFGLSKENINDTELAHSFCGMMYIVNLFFALLLIGCLLIDRNSRVFSTGNIETVWPRQASGLVVARSSALRDVDRYFCARNMSSEFVDF